MNNRVEGSNMMTQLDLEGLPRHIALTDTVATYQMKVSDTVLIVISGTGEDATGIVTLPSVAEAVGKSYYIDRNSLPALKIVPKAMMMYCYVRVGK